MAYDLGFDNENTTADYTRWVKNNLGVPHIIKWMCNSHAVGSDILYNVGMTVEPEWAHKQHADSVGVNFARNTINFSSLS